MDSITNSGLYYPNLFARIIIKAIEEILGKNGINCTLSNAQLHQFIDQLPPPNLKKLFDFSFLSRISLSIEQLYGRQSGFGINLRSGRAIIAEALRHYGDEAGINTNSFKLLPITQKMDWGLTALADTITSLSDQPTILNDTGSEYEFIIEKCPVCWHRSSERQPVCYLFTGLLQETTKWLSCGKDYHVQEIECIAMGNPVCRFIISKKPI